MGTGNMVTGLIPARFLTLIAHLVLVIVILWTRDITVRTCVPSDATPSSSIYTFKDTQMIIGLSISLGFFALELMGFLSGVSMFIHTQGLLSTAVHAAACVALAFFIFDEWHCDNYWYIFGVCSAFPAFTEICVIVGVLSFRKGF